MRETIAQNDYYIITVDRSKNRAYFTLMGYWKSRQDVPEYLDDWRKAGQKLSRGFTVLSDLTRMKVPPPDVAQLHTEAQRIVVSAGSTKTAELVGHDVITRMAIDRFSQDSGMRKRAFESWGEANDWLDEKEPS